MNFYFDNLELLYESQRCCIFIPTLFLTLPLGASGVICPKDATALRRMNKQRTDRILPDTVSVLSSWSHEGGWNVPCPYIRRCSVILCLSGGTSGWIDHCGFLSDLHILFCESVETVLLLWNIMMNLDRLRN